MDGRKDTALGLGERLRSARKARALTLEQAANALHLEAAVLVALEEERFAALGAPVFVRGHLRSYARLLELSEEAVLDAYRAADPAAQSMPRVARNLEAPVRQSPGPLAIAAFLVFLLLAVVLTYVAQDEEPPPPAPPALPDASPDALPPAGTPVEPASVGPPPLVPAPVTAPATEPPPAGDGTGVDATATAPPVPATDGMTTPAPAPPAAAPTAPDAVTSPATEPAAVQ